MRWFCKREEGFSLIESVVAIFLVSILLALVTFAFNADQNQVSFTDAKAQSVTIANSILDATSNSASCGDLTVADTIYTSQFTQYCNIPTVGYLPSPSSSGYSVRPPTGTNGVPYIGICNTTNPNTGNLNLVFDSPSPWFCINQTANRFLVQTTSSWADPTPPASCPSLNSNYVYAPKMINRSVTEIASTIVDPQTFTYQRSQIFRPGSVQAGQKTPLSLLFTHVPSGGVVVLLVQLPSGYDPSLGTLSATSSKSYYFEAQPNSSGAVAFPYLSDAQAAGFHYQYAITSSLDPASFASLDFSTVSGPSINSPTTCVTL